MKFLRAFYQRLICPSCGSLLKQVETADYCDNCDYEQNY